MKAICRRFLDVNKLSFVVMLVWLSLALVGCAEGEASVASEQAIEEHHFKDLATMVATSDLVVIGTVAEVRDGRTIGEEFQFEEVVIAVESVLYGEGPGDRLVMETEKFGSPYSPAWDVEGKRIVAFLVQKDDPGEFYREVSSQGIFLIDQGDLVATIPHGAFASEAANWTLVEFLHNVEEAAVAARTGEVQPQEPGMYPGPVPASPVSQ